MVWVGGTVPHSGDAGPGRSHRLGRRDRVAPAQACLPPPARLPAPACHCRLGSADWSCGTEPLPPKPAPPACHRLRPPAPATACAHLRPPATAYHACRLGSADWPCGTEPLSPKPYLHRLTSMPARSRTSVPRDRNSPTAFLFQLISENCLSLHV